MDFPSIAVTSYAHFPENVLEKPKTHFRISGSKFHTSVSTLKESYRSFSVSTTYASKRDGQECVLELKSEKGWVHFVGIGGSGLSALAMLAIRQGYEVSGTDIAWSSYMDRLHEAGACLHIRHSVSNIQRDNGFRFPNAVVVSSAIPQDNVEILYAKSVGVPIYKRGQWLGKLTDSYKLIAISGSHGKSTTASMLAYVLKAMGDDLTAVIGANVPQLPDGNIIWGGGQDFVLEADEYDCCFLGLSPYIAVVTNVDWEHVDMFPNEEAVKNIFVKFLKQIRVGGHLVICGDRNGGYSQGAYSLLDQIKCETELDYSSTVSIPSSDLCDNSYKVTTYGIANINDWHATSIHPNTRGGSDYILCHRGHPLAEISLQIPGVHNVLNSLAVIATVITLDIDQIPVYESIDCLKSHLSNFTGISRRFQMIGTIFGCQVYDDYAHHPTEVRAALQAARQMFPFKSLLVVFQPHTYSRLAALKDEFAAALSDADQVVITSVYSARENTDVWNIGGRDLAASVIGPPAEYIASLGEVVDKLVVQILREPHREIVVLTVGAGDITTVGPKLLQGLQEGLKNGRKESEYRRI